MHDISLADMRQFYELCRQKSLRLTAQILRVKPSYLSKRVRFLEAQLNKKLFLRSAHGMIPTREGLEFLRTVSEALPLFENKIQTVTQPEVTIGCVNFLSGHIASKIVDGKDLKRFRFLELLPDQLISAGVNRAVDIVLHLGEMDWPKSWMSQKIGEERWILIARTAHPLKSLVTEAQVREFPFVIPTYWAMNGVVLGNDLCPLGIEKRIRGHETSSATLAVKVVQNSNQLAFVPSISASSEIQGGVLKKIKVREWPSVTKDIFLSFSTDRVKSSLFKELVGRLSS